MEKFVNGETRTPRDLNGSHGGFFMHETEWERKRRQDAVSRVNWLRKEGRLKRQADPKLFSLAYKQGPVGFVRIAGRMARNGKLLKPHPPKEVARPSARPVPLPGMRTKVSKRQTDPRACHSFISCRKLKSLQIFDGGKLCVMKEEKLDSDPEEEKQTRAARKEIRDFSAASRRRLQRKLATINEDEAGGLPDFLTLTYPGEYSGDWQRWKRDLEAFRHALERKWPQVWGVWRLEFQKRGAPHFHALLWDGPQMVGMEVRDGATGKNIVIADGQNEHNKKVFEWMSQTWYRIVGSGDAKHLLAGTRIEPIQTWNGVRYYTSKYLAKLPEGGFCPVAYTGRFWGVIGGKRWRVSLFQRQMGEETYFKMRRVLRRRLERITGKRYGRWGKKGISSGITTFLDSKDAHRLYAWALMEVAEKDCPF